MFLSGGVARWDCTLHMSGAVAEREEVRPGAQDETEDNRALSPWILSWQRGDMSPGFQQRSDMMWSVFSVEMHTSWFMQDHSACCVQAGLQVGGGAAPLHMDKEKVKVLLHTGETSTASQEPVLPPLGRAHLNSVSWKYRVTKYMLSISKVLFWTANPNAALELEQNNVNLPSVLQKSKTDSRLKF